MYPTIHNFSGDDIPTQGYGALADCISCEVTEELNGAFTLEMTYPLNGLHAEYLVTGNIIVAKPSHNQSRQPFRITEVKKSFSNNIQVYANHICYDLSGYPVRNEYTLTSLANVISTMNGFTWSTGSAAYHQFTFDTDMTSSKTFTMPATQTVRSWMGGQDGSILDVYGGEWVYDNFSCFLTSRRGQDTGYRISCGKNLAEYEKDRNYTEYSHACAYWKKSDVVVYSDITPTGIDCSFRCGYIDATSAFDSQPSVAQLNSYVTGEIATMVFGAQTITVTPAQLGNDVIGLGDGVLICYETVFNTRVVKTVWDVLVGQYKTLQLGTKKVSITDTIKSLSTAPNGESSGGGGVTPDDYIVEQGSDGAWHWEKWNSGKAIAYTPAPFSLGNKATTGKYGNGWFATVENLTLPSIFNATPSILCQVYGSSGLLFTNVYSISATRYSIYIGNTLEQTVNNCTLNAWVMGRWK